MAQILNNFGWIVIVHKFDNLHKIERHGTIKNERSSNIK